MSAPRPRFRDPRQKSNYIMITNRQMQNRNAATIQDADPTAIKSVSRAAQKLAWTLWCLASRAVEDPDSEMVKKYRLECVRWCDQVARQMGPLRKHFIDATFETVRVRGISYPSWHAAAHRIASQIFVYRAVLTGEDIHPKSGGDEMPSFHSVQDPPGQTALANLIQDIEMAKSEWHHLEESLKKECARTLTMLREKDVAPNGPRTSIPASHERAYRLFQYAVSENPALASGTDRDVYDWLKERDSVEHLPGRYENFVRYLRAGRAHHDQRKNRPGGPASGRSIVGRESL